MAASGRTPRPGVIWTRPERTGRGPRPAHTRAQIAAAAVRIADADGLDAVSMRRVAAEVGAGTMSLYNYVPRKEDLYELMVDEASAEYDLDKPLTGDWAADVLGLAEQARDLMRRHPWLPRLTDSAAYGFSPNALRYLEHFLGALEPLDLRDGAKMELIAAVMNTVTGYVTNELALAERARSLPWSQEEEAAVRAAYLAEQLGTGGFPRLARALAGMGEVAGSVDYEAAFRRSLTRVMESFAAEAGAS
ncbi:TetR/AcrR family transcriptional regulator C-terminal domain-containing protein [Streptomyces boninensis]|uniref:TetR/AcrR family transcriptional regulator C-terminal domain-containing protein n=1 Tax=Streptomyces boninensis TaxID=2039455 RepID=UPI003B21E7D5